MAYIWLRDSMTSLSATPRKKLDQSARVVRNGQDLWALAKQVGIPSIAPMPVGRGDSAGAQGSCWYNRDCFLCP